MLFVNTHTHELGELEMFSRQQIWSPPLDMEGQIERQKTTIDPIPNSKMVSRR